MSTYIDPQTQTECVMIQGAHIVWDGITRPDAQDDGGNRWNLKVVIPPGSLDIALLEGLATAALASSEFRGQLPAGGTWPTRPVGPAEFGGNYNGWTCISGSTYRMPAVYDEQGKTLAPMQYGGLLFGNQQVDMLVSMRSFNNKSKGIKAQLEGFAIVVSAQAQQLNVGGGGINSSAAFGGGGGGGQQAAPAQQQPMAPQPPQQQPPAQQQQQYQQQQPPAQQQQPQQQPAPQQQYQQQPPAQQQQQQAAPQQQQPQQQQDFMPPN